MEAGKSFPKYGNETGAYDKFAAYLKKRRR